MRNNHEIKTYEIDLGGKNVSEVLENNQAPTDDNDLEEKSKTIRQINEDIYREHEKASRSNPFIFKAADKIKCNINSIEDFVVKVKRKQDKTIKEIIRGQEFKPKKKKKLVLSAIKEWIRDFKNNKSDIIRQVSHARKETKQVEVKKIGVQPLIFIPINFAIIIIIYFRLTKLWDFSKTFEFIGRSLNLNFANSWDSVFSQAWVNVLAVSGIYLSVASLAFIGLYKSICSDFFGFTRKHNRISEKLEVKVNNDFNSKSKKTLKYYKKMLSSNTIKMDALPIEQTGITDVDFSDIEALSESYTHKMDKMRNRKGSLYVLRFVLFKGTYACISAVTGYLLFEIVRGLF